MDLAATSPAVRTLRVPVLALLLIANFATVSLGVSITGDNGKFSLSNIMPMAFCATASFLYLTQTLRVRADVALLFLVYNACALLSFAIFLARFGWAPNLPVLAFQNVELLFSVLLVWYARQNSEWFRSAVRIGCYGAAAVMAMSAWRGLTTPGDLPWYFLGMDDKSHTAVLLVLLAFILIRFYDRPSDRVLGLCLLAMSLATTSRLPFLLLPAVIAAMAGSAGGRLLAVAAVGGAAAAFVVAGDAIVAVFAVFERISSFAAISGEGSTVAHLHLIGTGLTLKLGDVLVFIFGAGPGNFSNALVTFREGLVELQSLDPLAAEGAILGRLPVHSTPVSLFLDWNILLSILGVYLLLRVTGYLLKHRDWVGLVFLGCLVGASMFYSLHNKPYFYLLITTIAMLTMARNARRPLEKIRTQQG